MNRDVVLEPIIKSIRFGTFLSKPQILEYLKDWEALPWMVNGEHAGSVVVKGTELHFAVVGNWRPQSSVRGPIRAFLKPLLEKHGYLTTRVFHEKSFQIEFVRRMGFKPTWSDDRFSYFCMFDLPFERKKQ